MSANETLIGVTASQAILKAALPYEGLKEWPGAANNPEVVALGELAGINWFTKDEIPWCAIFVNAVLAHCNIPGTSSAMARSFMNWGSPVPINSIRPGDICVMPRGSNPQSGHVYICHHVENGTVYGLGGNQNNEVNIKPFAIGSILPNGVRRWDGSGVLNNRPTIKEGSRGAFVTDLQDQLHDLRYFAGRIDGHFGPLTRKAVVAFQSQSGLSVDGIVGPRTWAVLETAPPKPDREVSVEELRSEGSRTIETADSAETTVKTGAGVVVGLGTVDTVLEATEKVTDAQSSLDVAQQVLLSNWPILAVIGIGIVAYFWGGQIMSTIRGIRVDDARTGANLKR